MKRRRNAMVNIVPRSPPSKAIDKVGNHSISTHIPITSIAGTVKITPAANDSPALAIVWTALFSRILTSLNMLRKISIDMTAAGILAETVIPAYSPRYAFAAVIKIPRITPTTRTRNVSSFGSWSAGMYGPSSADMNLPNRQSLRKIRRSMLNFGS